MRTPSRLRFLVVGEDESSMLAERRLQPEGTVLSFPSWFTASNRHSSDVQGGDDRSCGTRARFRAPAAATRLLQRPQPRPRVQQRPPSW